METPFSRLRFWAIVFAVLYGAWWLVFHEPERSRPPGVLCKWDPKQGRIEANPKPKWRAAGWSLSPLASYSVRARVLSSCRYRYDATAKLSPVDLALGWGPMSDSRVLDKLSVSQRGRWYNFSYSDAVISDAEIELCSANTHIIPADDAVRDTVLRAIRGDIVKLEGWLVSCEPPGGGAPWRSSTSRLDTEGGACEIMFVEKAAIE